ncbi:MAG: hypothetical protein IJ777_00705 [Clostridia bacterium]|nr:hypothetical protein [Clostridia bacterium]
MAKAVIKEICIMLLLCIAILLILGVIFYEYIPSNKAVPNKLATYATPENVQSEINEKVTELEKPEETYEITSSDLNLYKQSHSYTSGKVNPFSASVTVPENEQANNTNTNSSNTTNNVVDPNSTGTFFNNTGLK